MTKIPDAEFDSKLGVARSFAQVSITKLLRDNELDAVLGPADARMASVAAIAGYAVGSLPLGYAEFNGRAFGVNIIAGERGEGRILRVMSAWEKSFPEARVAPPQLL